MLPIRVTTTDQLLDALRSPDWSTRVKAAEQLRDVPGERVTRALAEALDSDDTAVTHEALESLLTRDDPLIVDLIWAAFLTLDEDLTDHMWFLLAQHPLHPVTQELERRYEAQP